MAINSDQGVEIRKVTLAGATGNVGPAILKALQDANYEVTVLTRGNGVELNHLPPTSRHSVAKVDYADETSLRTAIQGSDVVVSALPASALAAQKLLIDASVAVGVKRFFPSEFGSDPSESELRNLPFYSNKLACQEYVKEAAKTNPGFSYTLLHNGPFLDWSIKVGFFLDLKHHTATIWDGGDVPISTTNLDTVGKAVVKSIQHFESTKNKDVYVQDIAITQNQLLDMAKRLDAQEWTITASDTADAKRKALATLQSPKPDMGSAAINQLCRAIFSREAKPAFTKLDNELLGIPQMTKSEVQALIKSFIATEQQPTQNL